MQTTLAPINRLGLAAYGMHIADQSALVAVPLAAALVFDASAEVIGLLLACQALAHLLGSLPFGLLVDRGEGRRLSMISSLVSAAGLIGATVALLLGNLPLFALSVTLAGFGIVLFLLVCFAVIPKIAAVDQIAKANAVVEVPRAFASFLIPLAIAAVIAEVPAAVVFAVAALAAFVALAGLPTYPAERRESPAIVRSILQGGAFVLRHHLLLPILLCALFWNLAFSALLVVLVPLLVDVYGAAPGSFGVALAAFGLGAVLGSWLAGRFAAWLRPNLVLLFGPGSSAVAACALALLPAGAPTEAIHVVFFALGFGPAMWVIAQNSVRQLVTPSAQLGSVNAVIQTAIYGMRPLGALLGGIVAGAAAPQGGLALVAAGFLLSFAAALFSRLRSVRCYADLRKAAFVS